MLVLINKKLIIDQNFINIQRKEFMSDINSVLTHV